MKRRYYPQLIGMVFIALGCRGKVYVADEYLGDSASGISDRQQDRETDTGAVEDTDTVVVEDTATGSGEEIDTIGGCELPSEFSWISSAPLISPPSVGSSVKDPTVVLYDDTWLVYATLDGPDEQLTMTFLSFTQWEQAASAEQTPVSENENLTGYKAAPQLFYFAERNLWYLIYQTQAPAYSTTEDPSDLSSWSAMERILPDSDVSGFDYWVICDDSDCYLFFSKLDSKLYRARTTKEAFPDGFEDPEIVLQDEDGSFKIYDACNVYRYRSDGKDQYLLLVSAIGEARFFQSWTSDRLDGSWTPLAETESDAFASADNVSDGDWLKWGVSQGEMLRTNPDETMTIDTCNMQYLFSGLKVSDENPANEYYCLGLLTAVQ
jgi:hypothetical protein